MSVGPKKVWCLFHLVSIHKSKTYSENAIYVSQFSLYTNLKDQHAIILRIGLRYKQNMILVWPCLCIHINTVFNAHEIKHLYFEHSVYRSDASYRLNKHGAAVFHVTGEFLINIWFYEAKRQIISIIDLLGFGDFCNWYCFYTNKF